MRNANAHYLKVLTIGLPLFLYGFIFRSLLLNIHTHLLDWFDFPYYAWTLNQNIQHFRNGTLENFFSTNIYYPHQGTLLFSDLLLPQSLMGLTFSIFTDNPITIVNLVFFLTFAGNVLAFYFFWHQLFQKQTTIFLLTFLSAFAPFLFLQLGHLQMITFWPFFLALGLVIHQSRGWQKAILVGLLTTLQFTASVYLGIFLLVVIGLWAGLELITKYLVTRRSQAQLRKVLLNSFVFYLLLGVCYLATNGFFIYHYLVIKNEYQITRLYGEYVVYAAHFTDYLFIPFDSIGHRVTSAWQKFNHHGVGELASYPGTVVAFLSLLGAFAFKSSHKEWSLSFKPTVTHQFFSLLLIAGFIFSLGPRLVVNGQYTTIPLPYHLVLKSIPLLEPIRATARWSFLMYLGLLYFVGHGFEKLNLSHFKKWLTLGFVCSLYVIEMVPLTKATQAQAYYHASYDVLTTECSSQPQVLLEYPLTESHAEASVVSNLSYRTQLMLASTRHGCLLVNGYSGFEPREYSLYEQALTSAVVNAERQRFFTLLDQKDVTYFKLNDAHLASESATLISDWLEATTSARMMIADPTTQIYHLTP
ncbi:MAG TPA: hypothetical protein VF209_04350 [Patescibacteria group bacterium]